MEEKQSQDMELMFLLDEKAIESLLTRESIEDLEGISGGSSPVYLSNGENSEEFDVHSISSSPTYDSGDFSELSPLVDLDLQFSREIPTSVVPSVEFHQEASFWGSDSSLSPPSENEGLPPPVLVKTEVEEPTFLQQKQKNPRSRKIQPKKSPEEVKRKPSTNTTSKKRRRSDQEILQTSAFLKDGKFIDLSSDELIKLDGNQIEVYIQTMNASKTPTPGEEKEVKRIRRLIKNREYAQSSRNKRKEYVDEIEQEVDGLKSETRQLSEKVSSLEEENNTLRSHLTHIGNLLKSSTESEVIKKAFEQISAVLTSPKDDKAKRPNKKAKTVGAALFIFLFSFALWPLFTPMFGPKTQLSSFAPATSTFSSAPSITTRLLLSNRSTLDMEMEMELESPTFFQRYAPTCLQTFLAKLNTQHNEFDYQPDQSSFQKNTNLQTFDACRLGHCS